MKKPRKRPYNGISEAFRWYEPLGPVPEVTAADQEDESFAAHAAIVADAAADCKRGKRANGALERANFRENGAFRRGSVGIGRALAVRGVRGGAANRAKTGGEQFYISVKTAKSCRIALFSMVSGVLRVRRGRFSILQKTDLQLNQNSVKNQAVPPWASASSAVPLFVAELPL